MSVRGLHHAGMIVSDVDRSISFYCGLLEASVRERTEVSGGAFTAITGIARALVADLDLGDGRTLELIQDLTVQRRPGRGDGSLHIGFQVPSIDAVHRRLVEAGARIRTPPIALVDAGPFWSGARVLYALDPDGTSIELVEMPPPARQDGRPAGSDDASVA